MRKQCVPGVSPPLLKRLGTRLGAVVTNTTQHAQYCQYFNYMYVSFLIVNVVLSR